MAFRPTEADTRANHIDPALLEKGWSGPATVWSEFFNTDGMTKASGQELARY